VTENGDQVALTAGFDTQDAESVLGVVTRSTRPARTSVELAVAVRAIPV
jgi:hypothetical protein